MYIDVYIYIYRCIACVTLSRTSQLRRIHVLSCTLLPSSTDCDFSETFHCVTACACIQEKLFHPDHYKPPGEEKHTCKPGSKHAAYEACVVQLGVQFFVRQARQAADS